MTTEIIAIGTGSAFTTKGRQTNFLVKRNGKYLLIDCGGDVRWSLQDFKLSFKDIDAVYVSHAHQDHVGGLEWLGFTRYFTKKGMESAGLPNPQSLPTLFCERGWVKDLWDKSLRGGMEGLEGIDCTLETFFNVVPIGKNSFFTWEDLNFDIIQSLHISAKYAIVDSFGLMFTDENGKRIYITTDVQFAPETAMKAYYNEAGIIIHDCETMYLPNGSALKSGVHAHYEDLKTLPSKIKSKMYLCHYNDNVADPPSPEQFEYWNMIPQKVKNEILERYTLEHHSFENWNSRAQEDGFWGFVRPGLIYSSKFEYHSKRS